MATLKELSSMTNELDRLGGELHAELTEGDIDFQRMVTLADTISEHADKLATAFNTMSIALNETLNGSHEEGATEDAQ